MTTEPGESSDPVDAVAMRQVSHDAEAFDEVFDPSVIGGFFLGWDNNDPPQLWVWRGEPDESAEPWQRVIY